MALGIKAAAYGCRWPSHYGILRSGVSKRTEGSLFPAKAAKHGIVSAAFSKRYGCPAAGVAQDVRMALIGYTVGGVSGTYGAGDRSSAKRVIEAVGLITQL